MTNDDFKFGDLVKMDDGHYGLVVDTVPDDDREIVTVFVGNGVVQEVLVGALGCVTLPGSTAHHNFAEWMVVGRP